MQLQMNYGWILIVLSCCSSCDFRGEKGVEFAIKNDSGNEISNVTLTTSEKSEHVLLDNIGPDETKKGFLPMTSNKTDGAYIVTFRGTASESHSYSAGYYTNGGPLESSMTIQIQPDTVLFSFNGIPY
jgi:hypothetical protein